MNNPYKVLYKLSNMKKIIILLLLFTGSSVIFAQKYAYVDTEYILDNIPEYQDAQNQLDDLSKQYQSEIEEAYAEIDKMYKNFQAESVLMPEDIKKKKEEELKEKQKKVKDLQSQRFGVEGDLFLKREELVKPIQEKIYNAIEEIAVDKNYAFVFDKAGSLTMLYVNAKYDISDDVLDAVGAELGTVRKEDRVRNEYTPPPKNEQNKPSSRSLSPPGGPGSSPSGSKSSPIKNSERK